MIENESILSKLNEIFIEFWGIGFENGSVSQGDKLLSDNVGLQPMDLVILLFEIEKRFNLSINNRDLVEGRFDTFSNIQLSIVQGIQRNEGRRMA